MLCVYGQQSCEAISNDNRDTNYMSTKKTKDLQHSFHNSMDCYVITRSKVFVHILFDYKTSELGARRASKFPQAQAQAQSSHHFFVNYLSWFEEE